MKKLVLKTTGITLAVIFCLLAVLFGVFSLFFPKTIASVADDMGNYSVSVFYYEKQYASSKNLNDLYDLVIKLNAETDAEKTEYYCGKLGYDDNFSNFAKEKDGADETSVLKTKEYVFSKLVIATYNRTSGDIDSAIEVAEYFVRRFNYLKNNPFSSLLSAKGYLMTVEELDQIKTKINSLYNEMTFAGVNYDAFAEDLILINELKAEKGV